MTTTDMTTQPPQELLELPEKVYQFLGKGHSDQAMREYGRACIAASQAVQAPEPAEYQYRTRPTWAPADIGWSDWLRCTPGIYNDYVCAPLVNDWQYETRKLFTATPPGEVRQALTDDEVTSLAFRVLRDPRFLALTTKIPWGDELDPFTLKFGRSIEAAHGIGTDKENAK